MAAGRMGSGDGRAAGVDGPLVGVGDGSGRSVGVLEGDGGGDGKEVGGGEVLGANGSGESAAVTLGAEDGLGTVDGEGDALAVTDAVGAAAEAGSGEDVTRTPRNPITGIARAVPAARRIKPGRCTIPPTVTTRPHSGAYVRSSHSSSGSNITVRADRGL